MQIFKRETTKKDFNQEHRLQTHNRRRLSIPSPEQSSPSSLIPPTLPSKTDPLKPRTYPPASHPTESVATPGTDQSASSSVVEREESADTPAAVTEPGTLNATPTPAGGSTPAMTENSVVPAVTTNNHSAEPLAPRPLTPTPSVSDAEDPPETAPAPPTPQPTPNIPDPEKTLETAPAMSNMEDPPEHVPTPTTTTTTADPVTTLPTDADLPPSGTAPQQDSPSGANEVASPEPAAKKQKREYTPKAITTEEREALKGGTGTRTVAKQGNGPLQEIRRKEKKLMKQASQGEG
ncbi:hypothetical protein HDV00_012516 [Rhizophlyctis rosea]|nr:hypothetical protein HDV00_012516 [Rhizophlyctis rosea]